MDNLLLTNNLIEGLGWTILHSLWQAVLLAGVLWLASRAIASARKRYWLAYGTLLAQLLVSLATFCWLYEPAAALSTVPTAEVLYALFLSVEHGDTGWNPNALLFWVVVFWVVGLLIGTIRLGLSFGRVRRMQKAAQAAVPAAFRQRVTDLASRLGYYGPLNIGVGALIDGPALVGHFKPLLLFPLAVVNQLSVEEAEAVVLHELAHLQRQDHWWNLLQCIIEVVFYYHPVVWWIGARIREEREHCCDDIVLHHGPGRLAYAKALLYFEEHRTTPTTAVALTNNPTGLLGRVQRFLHQQNLPYQMKSRLFLLPLFALIALVTTAAYHPAEETVEPAPAVTPAIVVNLNAAPTSPDLAPAAAPELLVATTQMEPDSLPQGRHQVSSFRNGKSTEVTVEDGEIKSLKIDGKTIPPTEYEEHEPMVERLLGGNELRSRGRINEGDFEDRFRGFEFHFDQDGAEWSEKFESMGEEWEDFGERMGELG
ncbi:MAG: M56 family metallopeptidase, partial [Bacteroidota bacterium]